MATTSCRRWTGPSLFGSKNRPLAKLLLLMMTTAAARVGCCVLNVVVAQQSSSSSSSLVGKQFRPGQL